MMPATTARNASRAAAASATRFRSTTISSSFGQASKAFFTRYSTGFGSIAPGDHSSSAAKKSSIRTRCFSFNSISPIAVFRSRAAVSTTFAAIGHSQPSGQIRPGFPHCASLGAAKNVSPCSSRNPSSTLASRFSSTPNVARLNASINSRCAASGSPAAVNIRRKTRRRSRRAVASSKI